MSTTGDTGRSSSQPIHFSTAFDRGKTPVACGRTEMPLPATNEWRYVDCPACFTAGILDAAWAAADRGEASIRFAGRLFALTLESEVDKIGEPLRSRAMPWLHLTVQEPDSWLPSGINKRIGQRFHDSRRASARAATPSPTRAEPPTRHPNESTGDFCRRVADWAGVAAPRDPASGGG